MPPAHYRNPTARWSLFVWSGSRRPSTSSPPGQLLPTICTPRPPSLAPCCHGRPSGTCTPCGCGTERQTWPASTRRLSALGAEASNEDTVLASVEAAIHPQAIGWWVLAALAAIVGLAVLGQALVRQSIIESEDYPTMAALGADRRQLLALGLARNLVVGLGGAVGAVMRRHRLVAARSPRRGARRRDLHRR